MSFCKQTVDQPVAECPFCYETEKFAKKGPKHHIAEHLEEFSLFALPDFEEWNDEVSKLGNEDSEFEKNETTDDRKLSTLGVHWASTLFQQLQPTTPLPSVGQMYVAHF